MKNNKEEMGLVLIYTGNGKGKTTAALGAALRAVGHGYKAAVIQFIKGPGFTYGEERAAEHYIPNLEIIKKGKGYYKIRGDSLPEEVHRKAARDGLRLAEEKIVSGNYHIVILDEINIAVDKGLLSVEEVLRILDKKPAKVHVILTGRNAHPALIERADVVTEMKEIKHPFQKGIKAQSGIDY
jgi:cob(I)alamin adenosyltransferase